MIYNGTIYQYGDIIPGHVSSPYTSKLWYDQSRRLTTTDVFSETGIPFSLLLGDDEDDMKAFDEWLEIILRYFNLHIMQIGMDFYLFDWDSLGKSSVVWKNLFGNLTKTTGITNIAIKRADYSSDSTQVTMDDVYNQIRVKCDLEAFDEVIVSPLDDNALYSPYANSQKYMKEACAEGIGDKARQAFKTMLTTNTAQTDYNGNSSAWFREWWMRVNKAKDWKFELNGVNMDTLMLQDPSGVYWKQHTLPEYMRAHSGASGLISFGSGDKMDEDNQTNIQNISNLTNYLVIAVNGNGLIKDDDPMVQTFIPNAHSFPADSDLRDMGLNIEYTGSTDGSYSPADANTTNYIVFSGSMILAPVIQKSGPTYINDSFPGAGATAFEALRSYVGAHTNVNTWRQALDLAVNNRLGKQHAVHTGGQEDGNYYTASFYDQDYVIGTPRQNIDVNWLMPPDTDSPGLKKFKYELGSKCYYENDVVGYVPVLCCEMKIGNKYCVEEMKYDSRTGVKLPSYKWVAEEDLESVYDSDTHEYRKKSTFTLGFNPQNGDWIIGDSHDIWNNIDTPMNLGTATGTAIPIKSTDQLAGKLSFRIVGIYNISWDNGVYTESGWWFWKKRSRTANTVQIMPAVSDIFINKFNVKFLSDMGGASVDPIADNDLIYVSDLSKDVYNVKQDISFKINTALTSEEAVSLGIENKTCRSTVINMSTKQPILTIRNMITGEDAKPEQHYVDNYYTKYSTPHLIIDTEIHDKTKRVNYFPIQRRFTFSYFAGKRFQMLSREINVRRNTVNLKLRQME